MIPRIFHTYWEGHRPSWVDERIENVRRLHPLWEVKEWDDGVLMDCLRGHFNDPKVAEHHKVAYRSNLIRYSALWRHGGIWLDSDMEVYAPMDSLREHEAFLPRGVNNPQVCVMGAEPAHPFIWRVICAARDENPHPPRTCTAVVHVATAGTDDVTLVDQDVIFASNSLDSEIPEGVLAAHVKDSTDFVWTYVAGSNRPVQVPILSFKGM